MGVEAESELKLSCVRTGVCVVTMCDIVVILCACTRLALAGCSSVTPRLRQAGTMTAATLVTQEAVTDLQILTHPAEFNARTELTTEIASIPGVETML